MIAIWDLVSMGAVHVNNVDGSQAGVIDLLKKVRKVVKDLDKDGYSVTDISFRMPDGEYCSSTIYYQDF